MFARYFRVESVAEAFITIYIFLGAGSPAYFRGVWGAEPPTYPNLKFKLFYCCLSSAGTMPVTTYAACRLRGSGRSERIRR